MGSERLPRRRVLAAGLTATTATVLAGCRSDDSRHQAAKPAPNPLIPTLATTNALLASYTATLARHPDLSGRLAPLRADHQRHAAELRRRLGSPTPSATGSTGPSHPSGPSPSPSPVPVSSDAAVAALADAEHRAQQSGAHQCLAAPRRYAALLGSITACRASHLAVLR